MHYIRPFRCLPTRSYSSSSHMKSSSPSDILPVAVNTHCAHAWRLRQRPLVAVSCSNIFNMVGWTYIFSSNFSVLLCNRVVYYQEDNSRLNILPALIHWESFVRWTVQVKAESGMSSHGVKTRLTSLRSFRSNVVEVCHLALPLCS